MVGCWGRILLSSEGPVEKLVLTIHGKQCGTTTLSEDGMIWSINIKKKKASAKVYNLLYGPFRKQERKIRKATVKWGFQAVSHHHFFQSGQISFSTMWLRGQIEQRFQTKSWVVHLRTLESWPLCCHGNSCQRCRAVASFLWKLCAGSHHPHKFWLFPETFEFVALVMK